MFIKHEVMQECELADIDPLNGNLQRKLENIDVGGRCENLLRQKSMGDKEIIFRRDALSFLSDLCAQIRKRFPLTRDSVLAQMRVIDVEEALSHEKRIQSLLPQTSLHWYVKLNWTTYRINGKVLRIQSSLSVKW